MIVAAPPTPSDMLTRICPPPLPSKSSNMPTKVRITHHPRRDDAVPPSTTAFVVLRPLPSRTKNDNSTRSCSPSRLFLVRKGGRGGDGTGGGGSMSEGSFGGGPPGDHDDDDGRGAIGLHGMQQCVHLLLAPPPLVTPLPAPSLPLQAYSRMTTRTAVRTGETTPTPTTRTTADPKPPLRRRGRDGNANATMMTVPVEGGRPCVPRPRRRCRCRRTPNSEIRLRCRNVSACGLADTEIEEWREGQG
jgi:hypothetical protein